MKVLVYTSPARGHLYPLVPTLDELADRGHEIAVVTLESQVDVLRQRGFAASPIASAIAATEPDDFRARGSAAKLKRAMALFASRAPHEPADLRTAIAAHRPDMLLVDCNCWGATAAAEAWGGPWGQWFPYPLPLPSVDVPPFGPGLAPAAGPLGRARDAALRRLLVGTFSATILPPVNAVRAQVGVPEYNSIEQLFTGPPLLLYLTAEPFEYPRSDWPANVHMIGPGVWDPPAEPPDWLDSVDRPLVLVNTSSEFQDDGRLVRVALDALADEDVFVVATLPAAELSGPVPDSARVERFVPHRPILARAACAITHGGMGATQKALAAGVPVCVVPFGRDQMEVARRVEVAGAGTRLPAARLRADRLREAVGVAVTRRRGAERIAAGFAATGGAQTAADAVATLVSGWAHKRPA